MAYTIPSDQLRIMLACLYQCTAKFFIIIIIVVIAFTATIAGTSATTVVGQNQTLNLTTLLTPDTNNDDNTIYYYYDPCKHNSIPTRRLTATNNMTIEDAKGYTCRSGTKQSLTPRSALLSNPSLPLAMVYKQSEVMSLRQAKQLLYSDRWALQ